MDLPHLNVLTKIDNLASYGPLDFNLDFYTEVQDLDYLLPYLDAERPNLASPPATASQAADGTEQEALPSKFHALNEAIIGLVEEFSLVGFETIAVEDKQSMATLLRAIDKAGGHVFGGVEGANDSVWEMSMRQGATTMDARDVQERWIDRREEFDEMERQAWEEEARLAAREAPPDSMDHDEGLGEETSQGPEQDPMDEDSDPDMRELRSMAGRDSGIKIVRKDGG